MNKYLRIFSIIFTCAYFFSSTAVPVLATISYTYDANGNMTSDGTRCFELNEANQVKKVKDCASNQTIAEYAYDYNGNRIVKKQYQSGNLQKTVISPNDGYEITKIASNGATLNTTYYYANDQLIAKKDPSGNKTYYQNDHLGSTSVATDQNGNLVEETSYDPWGEVKSGGTKSKFLYTGQEKDDETGLNYYNARYYDSHIRRFTQPDDIIQDQFNPQALNRYSYVWNNPLRYTDPTGHCVGPAIFLLPLCFAAASYITMVGVSPDSQLDMMNVSDALMEQQQSDSTETRLGLGIAVLSLGTPGGSVPKEVRQQTTKQLVKQSDNLIKSVQKGATIQQAKQVVQQKLAEAKQLITNGNNVLRIGSPSQGAPFRVSVGAAPKYYDKLNIIQKILSPVHIHIEKRKVGIDLNWFKLPFYKKW